MNELIDFLNYVDSGLYEMDMENQEMIMNGIKENPVGLWGFVDGIA